MARFVQVVKCTGTKRWARRRRAKAKKDRMELTMIKNIWEARTRTHWHKGARIKCACLVEVSQSGNISINPLPCGMHAGISMRQR